MAFKFNEAVIGSHSTGGKYTGLVGSCDCTDEVPVPFLVFQVHGQDHIHLQCTLCDESYCQQEGCKENEHERDGPQATNGN